MMEKRVNVEHDHPLCVGCWQVRRAVDKEMQVLLTELAEARDGWSRNQRLAVNYQQLVDEALRLDRESEDSWLQEWLDRAKVVRGALRPR